MKQKIIILIIFFLAFGLRIYGINWDQDQHLHPDERFLTMVASDIKVPASPIQYFFSAESPLNPFNYPQYKFFVYGTFPIFLTKFLSHLFGQGNYSFVHFWGRGLSAFFDSFNIILIYFIFKKIFPNKRLNFLPSLFYAFMVLPLQLSHFFAVDTFLTTFILATFLFMAHRRFLAASVVFGIALACKITAVYFIPVVGIFVIKEFLEVKNLPRNIFLVTLCLGATGLTFRIFQPYAFSSLFQLDSRFINSLAELKTLSLPNLFFPPAIQWVSKTPVLYPLQNMLLWGVGLPIFLAFIVSFFKLKKIKLNFISLATLFWVLFLFIYQGIQFGHTMRYFLPIYPFICLLVGFCLEAIPRKLLLLITLSHLICGILFLSIYSRPNSRVQATGWINQHLSADSTLGHEYWDDALPLGYSKFKSISLSFYEPDTSQKWTELNQKLSHIDYLILSSNRFWGSIPLLPKDYPLTTEFYQNLFSQRLEFKKILEINSYPGISLPFLNSCFYFGPTNYPGIANNWFSVDNHCSYPGIYLRDDFAEEAFTVYDHPKVLIFQNTSHIH